MKIVFFLALLANLVFFLWQYNAGAFHRSGDNDIELATSKPKQIWLLSEVKKNPPTKPALQNPPVQTVMTAPTAVMTLATKNNPQHLVTSTILQTATILQTPISPIIPIATKTLYCYQIKGFSNKAAVAQWAKKRLASNELQSIHENPPVVTDYLVHYPSTSSTEQKKAIVNLQTRGINEFFVINHGEFKGAISLGVFKNEGRAMKAQQVLISQGIQAKVAKRYKSPVTVSAQIKTEQTQPQLLATFTGVTPKPRIERLAQCH